MQMGEIVCLFLKQTNRRSKRALKGWVSNHRLKEITSQGAIQRFCDRVEKLYAHIHNLQDIRESD